MSVLLGGCNEAQELTCEPLLEDVTVVRADGPGAWDRDGWEPRVVELWRRGGTNPGEELAFPIFPSVGPDGRLAIPDFQLAEVVVIEPDGTWLGAWAERGEGPGEVAAPVAATWDSEGTLAVFDIMNTRVLHLRDGQDVGAEVSVDPAFTAPIVASGELIWAGVHPRGVVYLHPAWDPLDPSGSDGQAVAAILKLEPGDTEADTLSRAVFPTVTAGRVYDWPVPGWPRPIAAVGAGGVLALGTTDGSYGVLVLDSTGAPLHQVCRAADAAPLSDAERGDSVSGTFEDLAAAVGEAPPPSRPSPFGRLVVGARGRVWVQRSRPPAYPSRMESLRGQPGAVHDVFAADGTYLSSLRMPDGAALQAARGDTIWAFQAGEFDEVWVVAYALEFQAATRDDV